MPSSTSSHLDDGTPVKCDNCGWKGTVKAVNELEDPLQRIAAGEECPAGECPACGAVAHLANVEDRLVVSKSSADARIAHLEKALINIRDQGGDVVERWASEHARKALATAPPLD